MDVEKLNAEVERNYDAFQRSMSSFMPEHYRQYALLRHGRVVDFFADAERAEECGEHFADGIYSIQLVDPEPINLGLYSNG